jgi:hypothetical protein
MTGSHRMRTIIIISCLILALLGAIAYLRLSPTGPFAQKNKAGCPLQEFKLNYRSSGQEICEDIDKNHDGTLECQVGRDIVDYVSPNGKTGTCLQGADLPTPN